MKKRLLFLFVAVLTLNCYSQISFEKGYYIDNTNQKINCLIKNVDWKNNPIDFEYKISENTEVKTLTMKSVKEFGVYNASKYIRSVVDIDRSKEDVSDLSTDRSPIFKEEELYLEVLVEGKINLYEYTQGSLKRFFYGNENSKITQLIYKRYRTTDDEIGKNKRFRQQLWKNLKCPSFKISKVENLDYRKNELVNYFIEYNNCNNLKYVSYEKKEKRDVFNLTIRPRLNSSSLSIQNSLINSRDIDFGNKLGFGIGLEGEYILPFNKNKWTVIFEPTYQSFKAEKIMSVTNVSGGELIAKADYSSFELPIGLRHYFFLKNNSKIFVNASVLFDITSNSSIEFFRNDGSKLDSLEIESRGNFVLGLGYKYNDRYSLEVRYQTRREILDAYTFWASDYKTVSVVLGYSIF
ncbi:tRNA modification GTPase [Tenacibaculum aiptasiae]|uniref:tRNA modification GTPase n=1 Tax=Tenacibaculum aiptasiae TaxID=426481 RepID=UPI00232FF48B|nr:tRNA modification GTPase [Tenacibaculum aiptasiae]